MKTLLLGDKTPTGNTYYLQVEGDPKVYSVWMNNGEHLHWTAADLRDKKITPALNYDEITYFKLVEERRHGDRAEAEDRRGDQELPARVRQLPHDPPVLYPRGVDSEKQDQLIKGPQADPDRRVR